MYGLGVDAIAVSARRAEYEISPPSVEVPEHADQERREIALRIRTERQQQRGADGGRVERVDEPDRGDESGEDQHRSSLTHPCIGFADGAPRSDPHGQRR